MSDIVLAKSKLLCYFKLQPSLQQAIDQLLQPDTLPLTLYHYHYPAIYYPIIYQHLQIHLPKNITPHHIKLTLKHQEIPSDMPIGLIAKQSDTILVGIREQAVAEGFKLMMISWKKAYTIVNRQGGCDHVFKKLNESQQRQLYKLHLNGQSNGLNKIPKYQGNCLAIKICIDGVIIQRKQQNLAQTIKEYLRQLLTDRFIIEKHQILTHGIQINLQLSLKQLLEEWNYNDGFCYLRVIEI